MLHSRQRHKESKKVVEFVEEPETNTGQLTGTVSVQHFDKLCQAKSDNFLHQFVIDFVFVLHNLTNFSPDGADNTGGVLHTGKMTEKVSVVRMFLKTLDVESSQVLFHLDILV